MNVYHIVQKWNSQKIPHLSIDETQELIDEVGRLQESHALLERMLRDEKSRGRGIEDHRYSWSADSPVKIGTHGE